MTVKWGEPPPPKRGGVRAGEVADFVAALKTRPGEWAQYKPDRGHSSAQASSMKTNYPGIEVTSRKRADNQFDVYARWVGTNGDTP